MKSPSKPADATTANPPTVPPSVPEKSGPWSALLRNKLARFIPRRTGKLAPVAIRRPEKVAIQCELSLDLVKVVRNDLSDTDLEIVPAKVPAGKNPASVHPAVDGADAGENSRRPAATRLVGAAAL